MNNPGATVYVVGHNLPSDGWELIGIFSTVSQAEHAVFDDECFVGPVQLNVNVHLANGGETISWPGLWYPTLEDRPEVSP